MKKIILKSLALVNFKGVRDFSIAFNDGITTVCGDNGTGKTTLYDAYLWLLFGKDSTGRSDGANGFNVKTTGEDGKPIYRLEHSVTAVLEVDEKEIKLQRSLVEKWQKVNGTTEEVMKDETQYFINDVRTGTKKEYQAEISEIIPEDVFRMITNPYYFTSLGAETQKDMLLEMVGNIDDEEVAATDPDFLALLDQINGTSLAKWAREIAAKKRACNDALATIPASIETAQKLMPESENWTVLEKQLKEVQDRVKEIDAQIADKSALNDEAYKRKMALMKQQADKRIKLQDRENTIRMEANAAHNKALSDIQQMENELSINQKNFGHSAMAEWGLRFLKPAPDAMVLDCGCGGGANIKTLLKLCPNGKVQGIDYSAVSVEKTRKINARAIAAGRCTVQQASVAELPFEAEQFDVVTAFETVYFWPELAQNFREVYRVLKPGGIFFICNEANGETTKDDKWTQIIDGMTIYTDTALKEYLEQAGFCQIQSHKNKKGWLCVTAQKR